MSGTGSGNRGAEQYHFASLFPHFVLYGDRHIDPNEAVITAIDLVIDDATTLFYDFDAFGSVIDARPYIDQIAHANRLNRNIPTGPDPQIIYFTGKREIFSANTVLGQITASHNPIHNIGGSNGVRLQNIISVTAEFSEPVLFEEAMTRTATLSNYLGMLVGRPQNILNLAVRLVPEKDSAGVLRVYWCMPPRRDAADEGKKPHPADVLIDAVDEPDAFANVLADWLHVHAERHEARGRFFSCFLDQHYYSVDRLVAAANMFDILPSSAVPPDVALSMEQICLASLISSSSLSNASGVILWPAASGRNTFTRSKRTPRISARDGSAGDTPRISRRITSRTHSPNAHPCAAAATSTAANSVRVNLVLRD